MMHFIIAIVTLFSLALSGCISLKQPNMQFEYYTLEYDAFHQPESAVTDRNSIILKIKSFNASPIYNTDRIIYSSRQFTCKPYFYHKWRVKPAELVTYFLCRDLKQSGLFEAVLPHTSGSRHSHTVEGTVDTFLEWDSDTTWEAVLSLSVTLLASGEPDPDKRVIFQRSFSVRKKCKAKNPLALAHAMSLAMAEVSQEVGLAIQEALSEK